MKATAMMKVFNILVFGSLLYGLSVTFGTTNVGSKDASCNLKTQCLVGDHWSCNRHFTVVGLVSEPLTEREAEVDLVLIQTFFLFLWKLCLKHTS